MAVDSKRRSNFLLSSAAALCVVKDTEVTEDGTRLLFRKGCGPWERRVVLLCCAAGVCRLSGRLVHRPDSVTGIAWLCMGLVLG